jgi:citrate lyase beta subunit
MKLSLTADTTEAISAPLRRANTAFMKRYPGESGGRQPVHTVYGGAQLFKSDTPQRMGQTALKALEEYAPDFVALAKILNLTGARTLPNQAAKIAMLKRALEKSPDAVKRRHYSAWLAWAVYTRVQEKLRREPVEDFRIDFEDGYGNRPDTEEDGHAVSAAKEIAKGMREKTLSPFIGIRIKPFTEELRARSMRTLGLFVTALLEETKGHLPKNFFITLPKVVIPEQVAALADIFDSLEKQARLTPNTLCMEMMIETTQAIFDAHGGTNLPQLLEAARGRCLAAHFGTYDYTASCSITAAYQHMMHPACDFAKQMMKVAFAGTGLWLSDGATNIMPIAPHHPNQNQKLTAKQKSENRATVHQAWKLHYDHIQHSLKNAFYQGWDLHPAQLPTRYAAVYAFFLENLDTASERLRNFVAKAAQATLVGDVFDDAATGQGLLNYFLRAMNCGAISETEAVALTSLTLEELRSRSFVQILKKRQS